MSFKGQGVDGFLSDLGDVVVSDQRNSDEDDEQERDDAGQADVRHPIQEA